MCCATFKVWHFTSILYQPSILILYNKQGSSSSKQGTDDINVGGLDALLDLVNMYILQKTQMHSV